MSDNQRKGPSSRGGTRPGSAARRRPRSTRSGRTDGTSGGPSRPARRDAAGGRADDPRAARAQAGDPRQSQQASRRPTQGARSPVPAGTSAAPAKPTGRTQSPGRADLMARLRRFGLLAAATDGVAVLAIVTLGILLITVSSLGLTSFPASIASAWMVLNMSPVVVSGVTLGVVPAVPAMLFVAMVAWRTRREVSGPISVRDIRVLSAFSLGTPLVLTLVAWLMLWDASRSTLIDVDAPSLLPALLSTLLLRVAALTVGIGPKLLTALLRRRRLPEWPVESLRLGADIVVWLWIAAALVVLLAMAVRPGAVGEAFAVADGAGGVVGLSVLSLLYLPNVAAAVIGVLVGASANVGVAEVGLFGVIPGGLPPLPVLGAMPQEHHVWFAVALVVPVAVVIWRVYRYLLTSSASAYYVVVLASVFTGVMVAAVTWMSGGELGYFGQTGTRWSLVGVLASVWVVLPAALTVVVVRGFPEVFGRDGDESPRDDGPLAVSEAPDAGDSPEEFGDGDDVGEPEEDDDVDGDGDGDDGHEAEPGAAVGDDTGSADGPDAGDEDEIDPEPDDEPAEDTDTDTDTDTDADTGTEPEPEPEPEPEGPEVDVVEPEPAEANAGDEGGEEEGEAVVTRDDGGGEPRNPGERD